MRLINFVRKMVGASAGSDGRGGEVPKPVAGDHTKFLRGDASYQAIAGGGDMLAANNLGDVADKAAARAALSVYSKLEDSNFDNPRLPSGGVFFDGIAGSASVADHAKLAFGLDDFSIIWTGVLPDYTPSSTWTLVEKVNANLGWRLSLLATGVLRLQFGNGSNMTTYQFDSTVGITSSVLTDDSPASIAVLADRDGNVTFAINGEILGAAVSIAAAAAQTLTNTGSLVFMTDGSTYVQGRVIDFASFTRLLSIAETIQYREMGVKYGDQWAAPSTTYFSSSTNLGFETDTASPPANWTASGNHVATAVADGTAPEGSNVCEIVASAAGDSTNGSNNLQRANAILTKGKRYRISLYAKTVSGNTVLRVAAGGGAQGTPATFNLTSSWQRFTIEFFALSTGAGNFRIALSGAGTFRVDAVQMHQIGCNVTYDFANANPELSLALADRGGNQLDGTFSSATACAQVRAIEQSNVKSLCVGGGSVVKKILSASATLDFGSINAAASADLTITVTGAAVNDVVILGLPAAPTAGIVWNAFVSAANTVTVRATNITASPVDPASATYRVVVENF